MTSELNHPPRFFSPDREESLQDLADQDRAPRDLRLEELERERRRTDAVRPIVHSADHRVRHSAFLAERRFGRGRHAHDACVRREEPHLGGSLEARTARLDVDAAALESRSARRRAGPAAEYAFRPPDQKASDTRIQRRDDVQVFVFAEGRWIVPGDVIDRHHDVARKKVRVKRAARREPRDVPHAERLQRENVRVVRDPVRWAVHPFP